MPRGLKFSGSVCRERFFGIPFPEKLLVEFRNLELKNGLFSDCSLSSSSYILYYEPPLFMTFYLSILSLALLILSWIVSSYAYSFFLFSANLRSSAAFFSCCFKKVARSLGCCGTSFRGGFLPTGDGFLIPLYFCPFLGGFSEVDYLPEASLALGILFTYSAKEEFYCCKTRTLFCMIDSFRPFCSSNKDFTKVCNSPIVSS